MVGAAALYHSSLSVKLLGLCGVGSFRKACLEASAQQGGAQILFYLACNTTSKGHVRARAAALQIGRELQVEASCLVCARQAQDT